MPKIHSNLTSSSEIHVPKGFTEASNDTALIKNSSGSLEYRALDELGAEGPAGPPGTVQTVSVVDITSPTELNSLGSGDVGNYVVAIQSQSGARDLTVTYVYNSNASTLTENAPYVMNTADGGTSRWVSISGDYQQAAPISAADGSRWITHDLYDALLAASGTGVYTGGILSVGTPNTTFSISDGEGFIVDNTTDPDNPTITEVYWAGKTNITVDNLATNLITFVSIDANGDVIQQTTRWTAAEARDRIILGVVVHVNKTNVDTVNQEQHTVLDPSNQVGDVLEGIGFVNLDGNIFSPNGSNMNIDKSSGVMMGRGINFYNDPKNPHKLTLPALPILTFQYRFSDGSNGATTVNIDPDNIDDNAGGLTALANNKWSVQRIYSFTSNNVKIQRGQTSYDSKELAIAGIADGSFITEPSIAANGMLRGFIVVKKGTTDLSNTANATFIQASKFQTIGGSSTGTATTMQDAYDNSGDPEIILNTDQGPMTIRDNATPLGTALTEVQDSSGTTNYWKVAADECQTETQAYSKLRTLADAANIATDAALGNVREVTLAGNRTLDNPTNLKAGATYIWIIKQDATGSRTLAYGSAFKFPGGTAPTLSTAANSVDILSGVSDGTNVYCSLSGDFQ